MTDFGDSTAVLTLKESGDSSVSFAELADRVDGLTAGLIRHGLAGGQRVAIMAPNSAEWVVVCLSVINAGGVAVAIDARLDSESLRHVLADCEPTLIFTGEKDRERIEKAASHQFRLFRLEDDADESVDVRRLRGSGSAELPDLKDEDQAIVFYTSGTTGPPKGVPLSHRNLMFELDSLMNVGLMNAGERLLLPLPLHHVYPFVVGLLTPVVYGVGIVLPQSMTGPHILHATKAGGVSTVLGVPRLYEALLNGVTDRAGSNRALRLLYPGLQGLSHFARRRLKLHLGRFLFRPLHQKVGPDLRLLASGGAALDEDLAWKLESLGWTVTTGYGLTETSPLLTLIPPGDNRFDSEGRAIPGVELRIAANQKSGKEDERQTSGPRGRAVGEIQVRGPNVFSGYLNLPERTKEAFTEDGWFRTEDQGWIEDDGYLHVLGRASTFVVTSAGKNISLEELEHIYAQHPAVKEIGLFMRERKLAGVAVPDPAQLRKLSSDAYDETLRKALREQSRQLPDYKRIGELVVSPQALARTRLGKIRRNKLRERFDGIRAGRKSSAAKAGPMPIEEMSGDDQALLEHRRTREAWDRLAERFPEVALSPDSDLTQDLGIDSLEWINITLDIRERTGVELSEAATSRVETVRDLLHEILESADGTQEGAADLVEEPEKFLTAGQKRWLEPLNAVERGLAWMLYHLNRLFVRAFFRVKVSGLENLRAQEQVILAPNHVSYLDPFVIAAIMPYDVLRRSAFAGWTGVAFANPLFRFVVRLARTIPIETDRAAFSSLALAFVLLRRGGNLVWFAEGERSRDGTLQRMKPGIGIILSNQAVPVLPAIISGTFEAMPLGQWFPRPTPVKVHFGEACQPSDLEASGEGETPQERIAGALHEQLRSLKTRSHD